MVEKPDYKVVKKEGRVELREYPGCIVARTDVKSDSFKDAANEGFGILADFIFGNNRSRSKIAMTAPVGIERKSEKISMTAPVTIERKSEKISMTAPVSIESKKSGSYSVSFIMPKKYTLETLPEPNNKSVEIKKLPAQRVAAIRFSGFFNEKKVEAKTKELLAWMKKEGLVAKGDITAAGYDPPWIPWFLARNEVMIRV